MKNILTRKSLFGAGVIFVTLTACSSNDWQVRAIPSEAAVKTALDDTPDPALLRDILLPQQAALGLPESVRPCCAFGNAQRVQVGEMPIPFYRHANTVDLESIGAHAFDAGGFSYQKISPDEGKSTENNGVLYTLKGGFIDLAHIRDTADNTVAIFYQVYPNLGKQTSIKLPYEIGDRSIEIEAFDVSGLTPEQRWEVAAAIAARMGFAMAEAHEIAQWHGYRSFALWSEAVSAYSIEDLYSNMLGAKIAQALITDNLVMSRQQFNYHMTSWLAATLAWLQPLSVDQTNALFDGVDGLWWDSNNPLPNKFMLLKRHYQLGHIQQPFLVPQTLAKRSPSWPLLAEVYQNPVAPHRLSIAQEVHGVVLDDVAKLYLHVDDKFKASFEHIPTGLWQQGFDHTQFVEIAEYDQQQDVIELEAHLQQYPQLPLANLSVKE
ncbi:DUF4056 domain-containing protein [Shewanella gaetbuli]|uniref:DUF4056 domain-containing protein n=1 Tax=Shewanella gaetbuli TaxID=220752 RepID=A0A9X1ZKH6_9GAMM|nr:DUF4056 domain-containing protein [Shewanella gaetbuli]MCL1143378.1 DUF4056 domain-containing protein [Shewanella gaetbuli]